jgi:hypothetical protein
MSQFPSDPSKPKPKKPPVKHTYIDADYSPWLNLNERDAASIASNTATAAPVLAVASAVESLAFNFDPALSLGAVGFGSLTTTFLLTWLVQTIGFALLKTIACLLRNRGESLFRDVSAWVWKWIIAQAWQSFRESFFGWWPVRRERVIKPVRPVRPDVAPEPRKRIIDRIIPRRRVK